jgi:hypothetical protein
MRRWLDVSRETIDENEGIRRGIEPFQFFRLS